MGVVYLVRDERLGRQVALKVIAPDLAHDGQFRDRFEAEARSAAAIEHPNAVPIYTAGSFEDGNLFIAMRYVEGTDLREALAESGPLSPRAAAAVVSEVGAALDAAHAAGFVHRDVKPANILLTGAAGSGTAFLTDFGLTRGLGATQTQLTGTGQWIGTLDYVAPEQMAAGRVDARTDIYSLGCVLYEMLTGSVPFPGDEMRKLWAKANEEPPPLPASGGRHAFDSVLARAIAREPDRRFRSAGDLGRAAAAAAGAGGEAPTELSVATGVAAAGLLEAEPPHRPPPRAVAPPHRPSAHERPTAQMPSPQGGGQARRRSSAAAVAIVVCAIAAAAGLVAGALVLAGGKGGDSRTVIRRAQPATGASASAATTAAETEPAAEDEGEAAAGSSAAAATTRFHGGLYSVAVPAGWAQEEEEALASDGSYVENTWNSPAGDESLKIDESPGDPADPVESANGIGSDLSAAGETVYSVRHGVEHGGVVGSELAFRANEGLPERVDFFFNIGDNGFAVLGSAYDLEAARQLVGPVVASLEVGE
jgi:hypothetical protein